MRTALAILLTASCAFGQAFTVNVARAKSELVVSVPLSCTEMEVVITDTRGNVVNEAIGGTAKAGKLSMRFPAPPPNDYEVCVRLDPMNPATPETAYCLPIRLTKDRVKVRLAVKPKPAKKASLAQKKRMAVRLAQVKPPPPLPNK